MTNYEFSDLENSVLSCLINLINKKPNDNHELFLLQARYLSFQLPNDIKKELYNFLKYGSKTGFLLFENVYIDKNIFMNYIKQIKFITKQFHSLLPFF